ncbi:MAG: GIY-YIG nuclease family protein [Acidimicrobiales bacterium]|nr:GIY-YIG nuclease family protein [Acidimicrobiales bacterium]
MSKARGVYAIVNEATGKAYIGSAVDVRRRWQAHRRHLRRGSHPNRYLQASWDRHGEPSFRFELVELVSAAASLVEREQAWLDALRPFDRDNGYNLSPTAYSILGYRFTPEQRENVATSCRGKPKSAEHRARLWANREVDESHREQMRLLGESGRGVPKSAEHRRKIGAAHAGSKNTQAKLTEEAVTEIRRRLAEGETGRSLARTFGVHESIVSEIKTGRRWRHVPTPTP